MNFSQYQSQAHETAVYPQEQALAYLALGLAGEAGELANKVKKILRGDFSLGNGGRKHELVMELSDVLWYCAELSRHLGYSFNAVAELNLAKLRKRAEENKIKGTGDNR